MVPALCANTAAVPPPSYRRALQKQPSALHGTALTLVTTLPLLDLCRVAVRLAHRRCPPPLPKGSGGRPRTYHEESLLLIRASWTCRAPSSPRCASWCCWSSARS